jgi:hypothetical protein
VLCVHAQKSHLSFAVLSGAADGRAADAAAGGGLRAPVWLQAELWLLRAPADGRVQLARLASGVRPRFSAPHDDADATGVSVNLLARGEGAFQALCAHGALRAPAYALLGAAERRMLRNNNISDDDANDDDGGYRPAYLAADVQFTLSAARAVDCLAPGWAMYAFSGFRPWARGMQLVSVAAAAEDDADADADAARAAHEVDEPLIAIWPFLHAAAARMDWQTLVPPRRRVSSGNISSATSVSEVAAPPAELAAS